MKYYVKDQKLPRNNSIGYIIKYYLKHEIQSSYGAQKNIKQ